MDAPRKVCSFTHILQKWRTTKWLSCPERTEELLVQPFFCPSLCDPLSIPHNLLCVGQLVNCDSTVLPLHAMERELHTLWYSVNADTCKMPLSLPPHCPSAIQLSISEARTKHLPILQSTFKVDFPQTLALFPALSQDQTFASFQSYQETEQLGEVSNPFNIQLESSQATQACVVPGTVWEGAAQSWT